jgi:hypothetical protein
MFVKILEGSLTYVDALVPFAATSLVLQIVDLSKHFLLMETGQR